MPTFDGRTVVVTGAGSGIGAATARIFAERGAAVVVSDVDGARAADVANGIVSTGGEATTIVCDVASSDDWNGLADRVHERYGDAWCVVNNAFVVTVAPLHEQSLAEWQRQLDVDLTSVYHAVRTFLPDLRRTKGSIVNTASVHALLGFPGHPAYAAAKGGMVALTRQLAVEYGPDIRVNAVLPGPINTPHWDSLDGAYRDLAQRSTPAARLGRPEEVATAIAFLASEDASYVSGASMVVDGGFTAQKDPA